MYDKLMAFVIAGNALWMLRLSFEQSHWPGTVMCLGAAGIMSLDAIQRWPWKINPTTEPTP